jgi:hypothetical protein
MSVCTNSSACWCMVIKMTVSGHVRRHLISSSGFFPEPPH